MTYNPIANYPPELIAKVEKNLQQSCPSAEQGIIALCEVMAHRDIPDQQGAFLRRVTMDADDLAIQMRWDLGQALILMHLHPEMLSEKKDVKGKKQDGMVIEAQLLLRTFIKDADKVFFENLSESRRGGTVGGWIFHMSIDNAIYRALSALDRLAVLVWHAANLSPNENIYFRSGKMEKVHAILVSPESSALVEISKNPLLELVTDYRDGFTHSRKAYSQVAGFVPVDSWITKDGQMAYGRTENWDADTLFALANAAYAQFREALPHVTKICENRWASSDRGAAPLPKTRPSITLSRTQR